MLGTASKQYLEKNDYAYIVSVVLQTDMSDLYFFF